MAKADYHIEQMRSTKELLLLFKKTYARKHIYTLEKCVLHLSMDNRFLLAIVSELHPHVCYPLHSYKYVVNIFCTIIS